MAFRQNQNLYLKNYLTREWVGEYEFELKNGIPDGLGTFTRSDGEKCYENWKDGKIVEGELHTDLPESLSAKLTLKEFEEIILNGTDEEIKENTEESARKLQEELDKHDDYFPTDQTWTLTPHV